jgi:Squalene-hopene cyclase C-terminal domain
MQLPFGKCLAAIAFYILAVGPAPTLADPPNDKAVGGTTPGLESARKAIGSGLAFLKTDATKWREERKCATCHHGTMTVWALSEAKSQGFQIDAETLKDVTSWTKERLENIDTPRDTRPGWNMLSTPAVYLALLSLAVPSQEAVSPDELKRITGHLLRHQESNGSWAWSLAPAKNRPPPVFESDEVVTLMACMVLSPPASADRGEKSPARDGRARAAAWLTQNKTGTSTQARSLELFREVLAGKAPRDLDPPIKKLLRMQNPDGGWGQERNLPSDAYATGQALYFLSLAGVVRDNTEIKRAVTFLVANQKDDGSWPMTSRSHPGEKPMSNPVPITYFGSAWATLGLLRSVP